MFTTKGVTTARNPAEATARYWLMRAGEGLPEEQQQFEAELHQTAAEARSTSEGVIALLNKLEARPPSQETAVAAARLLVYQTLYVDCFTDLGDERAAARGVSFRTDYKPIERLAEILDEHDKDVIGCLPPKTETVAYPGFAYVAEQGEPITVIHGDFSVAQAHIIEARNVPAAHVVALASQ